MERTTDLEKLRRGALYAWGQIIKIHDVGRDYAIIEFKPNRPPNKVEFTSYVEGRQVAGALTFDSALLICIAHSRLEANMARYMAIGAAKLLNVPNDDGSFYGG